MPNADLPPFESVCLRAKLIRVGGARPAAIFESKSEPERFSLRVGSENDAIILARHLYSDLEIRATVSRNAADEIAGGTLEEWEPLDNDEPIEAWREWFGLTRPEVQREGAADARD